MAKKKQIETHGKEETLVPTTLEQIWGFNDLSRYGTKNEDEYRNQLKEMNRTDLDKHARRVGVIVVESTARLIESLVREFNKFNTYLYAPPQAPKSDTKISPAVQRILNEGR